MELFLAALMVIGIFLVGPTLIGLGIVGTYVARERILTARALRYQCAGAKATATKPERDLVAAGPQKQK